MDTQTCQQLLKAHNDALRWSSTLKIPHRNSVIDASCPCDSLPAPTLGEMPKKCYYEFDPEVFQGRDDTDKLFNFMQDACPGCKLMRQRVRTDSRGFLHLEL